MGDSVFFEGSRGLRPWPMGLTEIGVVKGSVALEGGLVGAGEGDVEDWVR